FNQPVELDQVRRHLEVHAKVSGVDKPMEVVVTRMRASDSKRLGLAWDTSHERTFVVRPRKSWPRGSYVQATIRPGLVGKRGPLPSKAAWTTNFHTVSPLAVEGVNCSEQDPCGLEPIAIEFNNRVKARVLRQLRVTPKPRNFTIDVLDDWDDEGGREVLIEGMFLPGKTYTLELPAGAKDEMGERLATRWKHRAVFGYRPTLGLSPGSGTLEANRRRTIGIVSRHITKVSVRAAVYSDDDLARLAPGRGYWPSDVRWPQKPLATVEREFTLDPKGATMWSALPIDLKALVGEQRRPIAVEVSPVDLHPKADGEAIPDTVSAVYRVTDLGPEVYASQAQSVVAVHQLSTGKPVAGARISRHRLGAKPVALGVTDGDGLLQIARAQTPPIRANQPRGILVAKTDSDLAVLTQDGFSSIPERDQTGSALLQPGEKLLGKLISERGAYRPSEVVRIVGWVAAETPYTRTGLRRLEEAPEVAIELTDPREMVVTQKTVKLTKEGKYWAELSIPKEGKLGRYVVEAAVAGHRFSTVVKVEDYRTPEFEVTATMPKTDWVRGQPAKVNVHANYYFGGSVPVKKLTTRTACATTRFRPPGFESGWVFGVETDGLGRRRSPSVRHPLTAGEPSGSYHLALSPRLSGELETNRCSVSVGVQDISLQTIGAEATYTVHPASHYLGLHVPSSYRWSNESISVPVRAVDWAGKRTAAAAEVTFTRVWEVPSYRKAGGERIYDGEQEQRKLVKRCTVEATEVGPDSVCTLKKLDAGTYEIAAQATFNGQTTRTQSSVRVWKSRISGASSDSLPPPKTLEISVSQTEVKPGDPVEVQVRGPWNGASGVLVASRAGVRDHYPFVLRNNYGAKVVLKADDSWTPGVAFDASLALGRANSRPKIKRARSVWVNQGVGHRRLDVDVAVATQARPGAKVGVEVHVHDAQKLPVNGRLALWAVDEGVLSLTNYTVPDLLKVFVPSRTSRVHSGDDYRSLMSPFSPYPDPWLSRGTSSSIGGAYGSGAGFGGKGHADGVGVVPARDKFVTTPLFLGDTAIVKGRAKATIEIPDNLTTFRVMAVASTRLRDGKSPGRFGFGDARIQVSTPLMVRPALPRGLRPGDRAELAAIIQNNTGKDGVVEVVAHELSGTGTDAKPVSPKAAALAFRTPSKVTVPVAAGAQVRVPFAVDASRAHTPVVEFEANLRAEQETHSDRVQVHVPVAAEQTLTERVAIYGSVNSDQAIGIPMLVPGDVRPEVGGAHLSTSSSLLAGLEDAVTDLVRYPYGCIEQTSSRLLPLVALAELSATYPLGLEDLDGFVRAGIERILSMQTNRGGFAYWPGGSEPHAYATAYATWVLMLARDAGYPVAPSALDKALSYLETQLSPGKDGEIPHQLYHSYVRQAIAAYTLAQAGRDVKDILERLHQRRATMPVFARTFVLMALHRARPEDPRTQAMAMEILGDLAEQPGTAHVKERVAYDLSEVFHSSARSDAIVLRGLLEVVPDHPVVEKLARGLLGQRVGGRWRNTQENAYAVMALAAYARVYEREEPDFLARAWVARKQVLDTQFQGRAFRSETSKVAMVDLLAAARASGKSQPPGPGLGSQAPINMILQRLGQGRMYYRLGVEWAPSGNNLPASRHGLAISRSLRTSSGELAPGQKIAPGATVALDLTIESSTRVPYVVLDVPIPAGLEAIQRSLGRGQGATSLAGSHGYWVSHEELRSDRALVFADNLPAGVLHHSVPLRATTPGRYALPPAQAEAMYMPEIYGRSTGTTVVVDGPTR
ncbi:MAG: alpha-2-macroglobulin family protein, partial [Nannocystaceae bacterium]